MPTSETRYKMECPRLRDLADLAGSINTLPWNGFAAHKFRIVEMAWRGGVLSFVAAPYVEKAGQPAPRIMCWRRFDRAKPVEPRSADDGGD